MIRKSMSGNHKPFLLKPSTKDYLWGGRRLYNEFNKEVETPTVAETWECSTHPDGPSRIMSGEYEGLTLTELLENHPEFLGSNVDPKKEFPVLIKFIDAKEDLSIQVHPDDDYAMKHEQGQLGKTEMWYVVDADKEAKLIHGFQHTLTKDELRTSIEKGDVERYLRKVKIEKDDVFFMEAGTVHAIGSGALILEVQENSNLTYRMYDYQRTDKHGQMRELHVEKALEVVDLHVKKEPKQPIRMLQYSPGIGREFLCRCKHFQVKRYLLNTEHTRDMAEVQIGEHSFKVLVCMSGCGIIFSGENDKDSLRFCKGDCIFVPAMEGAIRLHGKAKLLGVNC
ncbi:MAG: type I phosphomannose isomerase catalytic subunit [Eubacteriales bacterium]